MGIALRPSERVRELEKLLAQIRNTGMMQLNYDMWDRWGSAHSTPEQVATMNADLAQATREQNAAKAALQSLVAATRAEAPAELVAWADAHHAYLTAFLEDCEPDSTAASVATDERAAWVEVREGTLAFVDENLFYVTLDEERYRRLFGIDPRTLEPVD